MPVRGLRSGDVLRIRGQRWLLDRHVVYDAAAIMHVTGCDADNATQQGRFLLPFEQIERLPVTDTPRLVTPARWRHTARAALATACASPSSLRSPVRHAFRLMPFQLEPAIAVVRGLASRLLVADAVGLGKTLQAGLIIAELLERESDPHALVICPSGLRDQWRHELLHHFGIAAAMLDAAALSRAAGSHPDDNPWSANPVVIASIDFVKRPEVMRSLEGLLWDAAVFDEAHVLSGRSDRTLAASCIAERARTVVMLTATPHSGDDSAFERLCTLGDLRHRFPLLLFRRTRVEAGVRGGRRTTWLKVRPTAAEHAMHAALREYATEVWRSNLSSGARLAMVVLSRRASSSPAALARSIERRLACLADDGWQREPAQADQPALPYLDLEGDDDQPGAALSAPGLAQTQRERRTLRAVLALAHMAAGEESKVTTLQRLLRRTTRPAIVFTEYRDTLERLAHLLDDRHAVLLHGGLTARERAAALRQFTTGTATLLLATDAASEGLNLHHRCCLLINLELPWTPLRLEQRAGRIDRLGQSRRVHIVHLVAAGTDEEAVVARLYRRMVTADAALHAAGARPVMAQADVASAVLGPTAFGLAALAQDAREPCALTQHAKANAVKAPFVTCDLRALAHAEVSAIAAAREMYRLASGHRADERPVLTAPGARLVTRMRGDPRHSAACRYWVFRLACVDGDGRPVWSTLLALAGTAPRFEARRAPILRRLLTPCPSVDAEALSAQERALEAMTLAMQPCIDLALQREDAIAARIGQTHARLAALVQPGLFGRTGSHRDEQAAMSARVLARARGRIRDLERRRSLTIVSRDLVFAVLLG